ALHHARMSATPYLEVCGVDFSYGPLQVLFGVDIHVARGEVLALLGTNGAGKSTVLRAVSGLGAIDRGTVTFDGRDITRASARVLEPTLLLVDELSLGLAPIVVQQLLEVVEALRDRGVTIVLVEQSVNVALSIAHRAIFMEKGEVRFEGPASQLLERDDLVRA